MCRGLDRAIVAVAEVMIVFALAASGTTLSG
jgi:hypothetical protein